MAQNRTGSATRERILAAALAVAGREGLEALTTRRVAEEAGANLGLLHYYFESKEALVEETIGLYFGEMRSVIEASAAKGPGGDPQELLTELFASALEVSTRRPAMLFGLISRLLETIKESLRKGGSPEHPLERLTATPFGPLAEVQGLLLLRIKPLLASRLGSDEALVARRSVQLFASLLHPIIFTPFPRLVFGCDLGTEEARREYVRAVVADALRPPEPRA
jgi:AcrR family transcriptional regulator